MDYSDAFRFINLAVGVFLILGGVGQFFPSIGVQNVIIAVYLFIFGVSTALLEFQIPPQVARYANFMFSFIGRGVLYLFLGCITMGDYWWKYVAGAIVALVGVAYIGLEFVPSIEPPANMRDADQGWGAEQV
ncbi:Golgi apparatus membrane protein [Fulvia fulva]|uniref:Golgi apparatus membrane protein n=1 Tax=Passalora fulva TaxID=5499 RepID=A0A9Q8USS5_PASFU|nr:Golgi apparatus membrane protein [Fulvia fulva]KAK4617450.1 Golgi apparatus membrane protein [Fulvia fulva]KAK4619247.1 Golgi apparatus membrane protein [Fulvia fulva]UJO21055.1 Golgi apparatus membrane protein [Fulvia fulva]WPV18211.1 Golgi apparatus membrane protein [Fulvia fulva]WPV33037.1 Golgi apparatus membrane protein [Fulvia fulva]